jgi:hypothetical protein
VILRTKVKTEKIVFRAEQPLSKFIEEFARANGKTKSELIRDVLVYFHMGFLIGEFQRSMPEFKEKFLKKFKNKNERKKFVRRYNPKKYNELMQV